VVWGFLVNKRIFSKKSKYQKIEIFENKDLGRVLVLDGRVQLSTKYEFKYHEMLVHPAMIYHKNPEKVLIIGGGDGGALREVVKYPAKEIFLVDIDREVIDASKKYLPSLSARAFKDKRLKIFNEDALNFVKKFKQYFDAIILDSTDPQGPSRTLFELNFFKDIFKSLKLEGVFVGQTGYYSDRWGKKAIKEIKKTFPFIKTFHVFVNCFPLGEQTFTLASKKINFEKIKINEIEKKFKKLNLKTRYYSPQIHFSSAVLPPY
jgi:spermidine synthase